MRKSFCSAFVASILIALLAFPRQALAWGNTGHEAVACAAWRLLDDTTKNKIFALLQKVPSINKTITIKSGKNAGKTETIQVAGFTEWSANIPAGVTSGDDKRMYIFMRAATWPDSIKNILFTGNDDPPAGEPVPDNHTLGFADRHDYKYWHFIDQPLGATQKGATKAPAWKCTGAEPAPVKTLPAPPQPNAAVQIEALATTLASNEDPLLKAYDLVWLEHLVGDIHQPLHASVRYVNGVPDHGGNCVAITLDTDVKPLFVRANAKSALPTELHAFWDDLPGIGEQMDTKMAADFAGLAVAYATKNKSFTPKMAADLNVEDWATESFNMATKDAYAAPVGPAFGAPTAYTISSDYYTTASNDAKVRVALAGARLKALLTKALN